MNKLIFSIATILCSFNCNAQVNNNTFLAHKSFGYSFILEEQKRLLYLYYSEEIDELTLMKQLPLHSSSEFDQAFNQTGHLLSIIEENSSWNKEKVAIFLYIYSSFSHHTFKEVYRHYLKKYNEGSLIFTTKYPIEVRNYILSFYERSEINVVICLTYYPKSMSYSDYTELIRFKRARNYRCEILKRLGGIHF